MKSFFPVLLITSLIFNPVILLAEDTSEASTDSELSLGADPFLDSDLPATSSDTAAADLTSDKPAAEAAKTEASEKKTEKKKSKKKKKKAKASKHKASDKKKASKSKKK